LNTDITKVSLETLAGGALGEMFDHEFARLLQNIDDPNTAPEAVRKIMLEVVVKPTKDREMAAVSIFCRSKLAGLQPHGASIFIGSERGQPVAYTRNPHQTEMDFPTVLKGGKPDAEGSD